MVDFNSIWDRYSGIMDRKVDAVLGDRLRYRHAGEWLGDGDDPAARTIEGFIVIGDREGPQTDYDEILDRQTRVKIAREIVGEVSRDDRIAHPKLGDGYWQPIGALRTTDGRYWIFDVQAAEL